MKNDRVEAVRDHSAARVMVGAFPRMPTTQDTRAVTSAARLSWVTDSPCRQGRRRPTESCARGHAGSRASHVRPIANRLSRRGARDSRPSSSARARPWELPRRSRPWALSPCHPDRPACLAATARAMPPSHSPGETTARIAPPSDVLPAIRHLGGRRPRYIPRIQPGRCLLSPTAGAAQPRRLPVAPVARPGERRLNCAAIVVRVGRWPIRSSAACPNSLRRIRRSKTDGPRLTVETMASGGAIAAPALPVLA